MEQFLWDGWEEAQTCVAIKAGTPAKPGQWGAVKGMSVVKSPSNCCDLEEG